MDKVVYLLIFTVITGQALQISGIIDTPKSAGAVEFQKTSMNINQQFMASQRYRRDTTETTERSQFIDMLFNRKKKTQSGWTKRFQTAMSYLKVINKIPIKTLTAVNNLVQNSRPAFRKLRDFAVKRLEKTGKPTEETTSTVQKRSPVFIREIGSK